MGGKNLRKTENILIRSSNEKMYTQGKEMSENKALLDGEMPACVLEWWLLCRRNPAGAAFLITGTANCTPA